MANKSRRAIRTGTGLLVAFIVPFFIASCADHDTQTLTDACVRGANSSIGDLGSASLTARCRCSAVAARKYLDPDDYKLLLGVATIYNTDDTNGVKLHNLVAAMIHSGIGAPRAAAAATDMLFLAHKAAQECELANSSS